MTLLRLKLTNLTLNYVNVIAWYNGKDLSWRPYKSNMKALSSIHHKNGKRQVKQIWPWTAYRSKVTTWYSWKKFCQKDHNMPNINSLNKTHDKVFVTERQTDSRRMNEFSCLKHLYFMWPKHLLRYWPILARSSTLHFAGAVNTRQEITVHIINLVYSEFPNRSCRSVRSFISTLSYTY